MSSLKFSYQALNSRIFDVENTQLVDDLKIIDICQTNIDKLLQTFQTRLSDGDDLDDAFCARFRHETRSEIGTLMGYHELILDYLPVLKQHIAKPFVEDISTQCLNLLCCIEKVEPAQTPVVSSQNETLSVEQTQQQSTILIIDDLADKRELFARRLHQSGHKVLQAENGQKGLDILAIEEVDLILLDILMPEMAGDDILKIIKSIPEICHIPILIISSMEDTDRLAACINAGADDYIPFPMNLVSLRTRIQSCLDKKKSQDRERRHQTELEQARYLLQTAIQSVNDGFVVYDVWDNIVHHNQKFADLYQLSPDVNLSSMTYRKFLKMNLERNLYEFKSRKVHHALRYSQPRDAQHWLENRLHLHRNPQMPYLELLSNGEWIEITENPISGGGIVALHKIVSQDIEKRNRLYYLADHDPLTKLVNRRAFDKSLQDNLHCYHDDKVPFAFFYIDLDGFKTINDTYGHACGDVLLQTVAERLRNSFRSMDTVARLGGDEFGILIPNIIDQDDVKVLAKRILAGVGCQFQFNDLTLTYGVSLGIALYPQDSTSLEDLQSKADQAMYQAKKVTGSSLFFAADL